MSNKHGNLSINSDNIFPIIKKWLYSDHDIFYRELISNGCDAITKLKKLDVVGEYSLAEDFRAKISVIVNPEEKTVKIIDNGIGMDADEIDEYINQIAFSGATDFIEKYKDKADENQIIGHFGLGFYSCFMVADEVHIDSLSFKPGAKPVHWECDGGTEFDLSEGTRTQVGTEITLFINEDCREFCNEYKAREVIKKYCSFMPVEIFMTKQAKTPDSQTIDAADKLESDVVLETIVEEAKFEEKTNDAGVLEQVETTPRKEKLKIVKRPELLNNPHPLWTKHPNECTKEQYLEFYRDVFHDWKEPLFWIHLNMDYPFNLKGILYFPKINMEYESIEGVIKLYNNQVFIADNIKEVIPEFLMLLKGVIDCPDLPLNVSRSALQNDGFVKKISDYISKKVADKLSGMCKTEKEEYEKYWDDISPFIKFGCLRDDKFCEKMTDYILFKNLDGKYQTLPECLAVKKTDPDETNEANESEESDNTNKEGTAVDENGNPVEAEIVSEPKDEETEATEDFDAEDFPETDESSKKLIYYVTDETAQGQYIRMFKRAKKDAVILTHQLDQPFISQLEGKNDTVKFQRIDADLTDDFKGKVSKKQAESFKEQGEKISALFKKVLKKDKLSITIEKLKDKKIASILTVSEEARRMQDMMKMYARNGMPDMGGFGNDDATLVLNGTHPLVEYLLANIDEKKSETICRQLYDLARIAHTPLQPEDMAAFIARSNDILLDMASKQ